MPVEHPLPTDSTIYKLYASSRGCAFPGCSQAHIEVDVNTGVKVCNTQVCHIHARRENGPRWDASQTAEANRSDSNLVLLCGKHHTVVDDRRNEYFYTPELLKGWKAQQEAQLGIPLTQEDKEAIAQTNVFITAETLNLGGQGGAAPGAGGGGGAAIGSNAIGGRGGDGGRKFKDGRLADASALQPWMDVLSGASQGRPPGSGGGGVPATGDDAVGGRGGDGGDIHTGKFTASGATYEIKVGRGARLTGEFGGSSSIGALRNDSSTEPVTPRASGGMSGASYLPDDVPEIDAAAVRSGVRICCLAVVESASLENGAYSVRRFGLSTWNLGAVPSEAIFTLLTAVTKAPDKKLGYFVSLCFGGEEKARIAVVARESAEGYSTLSASFPIGAFFETVGPCRIIAHASGILLCETMIDLRLMGRGVQS